MSSLSGELMKTSREDLAKQGYSLQNSLQVFETSNGPLGFPGGSHPGPLNHSLEFYSINAYLDETQQFIMKKGKIFLSDFSNFDKNSNDSFTDDKSSEPANKNFYIDLENGLSKVIRMHNELFSLSLKFVSSDCLVPLVFLDINEDVSASLEVGQSMLSLDLTGQPDNHYLEFFKGYKQISSGDKTSLVSHYLENDSLFLKVLCPFWGFSDSKKIIIEASYNLRAEFDTSQSNSPLYLIKLSTTFH